MGRDSLRTQLQTLELIEVVGIAKEDSIIAFDAVSNLVAPIYGNYEKYLKTLFPQIEWVEGTGGYPSLPPEDWNLIRKQLKEINPNLCNLDVEIGQDGVINQPL